MKRTIRRYPGAVLPVFPIVLSLSPVLASKTGPGTENPQRACEWCRQESPKAAVWFSKLRTEQGAIDAHRTCQPDFKVVRDTIPEFDVRTEFRRQIEADLAERVKFTRRMIELDNPHEQ